MSIKNVGKGLRRWGAVCGLILGGLCMAGCRTNSAEQQFAEVQPGLTTTAVTNPTPIDVLTTSPVSAPGTNLVGATAAPSSGGLEPEVFRVGDTLTVTFTDMPVAVQPFEQKISEDGTITLLQNITFTPVGMTPGELAKEIRKTYVPNYYKYMTVTVKQLENTRWYYVDGEVRVPNRQLYTSRITLLKAIATAGGFTDFANKKKVTLTRVDGRTLTVNCIKARTNPKLDPEVYPGDRIFVPRSPW
jgi:polysaccharide biosynthesis/export protein VpsN